MKKKEKAKKPSKEQSERANIEGSIYCVNTALELISQAPLTIENLDKYQHTNAWLREILQKLEVEYQSLVALDKMTNEPTENQYPA